MKFIITESEKNKILELYGLSNQSINEGLSDKTEFKASGSGSNWIITYKADDKFYPFSQSPEVVQRDYLDFNKTFNSESRANEAIPKLKEKLKADNKKPTNNSKYSNITTDVPSGKEMKYTTNIPTGYPSGEDRKYATTGITTSYASGVV